MTGTFWPTLPENSLMNKLFTNLNLVFSENSFSMQKFWDDKREPSRKTWHTQHKFSLTMLL